MHCVRACVHPFNLCTTIYFVFFSFCCFKKKMCKIFPRKSCILRASEDSDSPMWINNARLRHAADELRENADTSHMWSVQFCNTAVASLFVRCLNAYSCTEHGTYVEKQTQHNLSLVKMFSIWALVLHCYSFRFATHKLVQTQWNVSLSLSFSLCMCSCPFIFH